MGAKSQTLIQYSKLSWQKRSFQTQYRNVHCLHFSYLERLNSRALREFQTTKIVKFLAVGKWPKLKTTRRFAIVNDEDINKIVDNAIPRTPTEAQNLEWTVLTVCKKR